MKRPKWARCLRYKRVDWYTSLGLGKSCVFPIDRLNDCKRRGRGRILTYKPGTIVRSPNGVCKRKDHFCCRGIHAYTKKIKEYCCVYAARWYGDPQDRKQRAARVWVGSFKHFY